MPHSPPPSTRTASDRPRSTPGRAPDGLGAYTRDPFHGYLEGRTVEELIQPGSLLDVPSARRWFELMIDGVSQGVYTFQQIGRAHV